VGIPVWAHAGMLDSKKCGFGNMTKKSTHGERISHPDKRSEHPFIMWESLNETPALLAKCLEKPVLESIDKVADEIVARNIEHLIFTGSGSSFHVGILGSYALGEIARFPASSFTAFELWNYPSLLLNEKCAVIEISHSGGTLVGYEGALLAKKRGAYVVGVTEVLDSRLGMVSDDLILGPGGKDPSIPKTRSVLTAAMRILILAAALGERRKKGTWNEWMDVFSRMPEILEASIQAYDNVLPEIAKEYMNTSTFFVSSGGPNWASALEAALKFMEVSLITSLGEEVDELIQGKLVTIDTNCAVALIAIEGRCYAHMTRMAEAMKHMGVKVFIVGESNSSINDLADNLIRVKGGLPEIVTPITTLPALYLLAYWIAVHKGINPDVFRSDDLRFREAYQILMPPGSH